MEIIRLESSNNNIFKKIVEWNYNWWGQKNGKSLEEIHYIFEHSICTGDRLPQTFVALIDGEPVGMYQLSMTDDLDSRPDIYPWIANVYVDEAYRGQHVCEALMETVPKNARSIGLNELYLYTSHMGLYEKYGWNFVEEIKLFKDNANIERIYKLNL